jgi:hypothetical protein
MRVRKGPNALVGIIAVPGLLLCGTVSGVAQVPESSADDAAGFGPWRISVSVTPTSLGPIAVAVDRVRTAGPKEERRLIANLVFLNQAGREARMKDVFRTSSFAEGGTGRQLLVADEGCGYYVTNPGDPVEPGICQAYLDYVVVPPGESGLRAVTSYAGLRGMDPLTAGRYRFERRVRFRFPRGSRSPVAGNLTVSFDVTPR